MELLAFLLVGNKSYSNGEPKHTWMHLTGQRQKKAGNFGLG